MAEWQPIETAPKDGTPVMLFLVKTKARAIGQFFDGQWSLLRLMDIDIVARAGSASHWQPLPEPPQIAEGG